LILRLDSLVPPKWGPLAVSLGNFDGVHLGHARLAAETVREARAVGGPAVVLAFDPHPARVLHPERAPATLVTTEQKAELLAALGIDRLAVLPFTKELAALDADTFARDVLAGCLGAVAVVVGTNFRFGRGRSGDPAALARLGTGLGFRLRSIDPVLHAGQPISSTRIRAALATGDVAEAERMLGRRFFVDGDVVAGEGRGRTIGFPTANVEPVNETLPSTGVYACMLAAGSGPPRPAVANLGQRPTFGPGARRLEVHVLDFAGDLYGARVRVVFAARLRDEKRFAGPDELAAQIADDVARARQLLGDAL
jgi:riboflavin kinase / FMN adenylyltransferase